MGSRAARGCRASAFRPRLSRRPEPPSWRVLQSLELTRSGDRMHLSAYRFLRELELVVDGAYPPLDIGSTDHARDTDRGCRDDLDVDARIGERVEHVRGNTRMGLHPGPHERDLGDVWIRADALGANILRHALQNGIGATQVV